jgi:hypothetical protein
MEQGDVIFFFLEPLGEGAKFLLSKQENSKIEENKLKVYYSWS